MYTGPATLHVLFVYLCYRQLAWNIGQAPSVCLNRRTMGHDQELADGVMHHYRNTHPEQMSEQLSSVTLINK